MKKKPTITYRIEDDFYKKLEKFTNNVLTDGYKLFEKEFGNIDSFYQKTLEEDQNRDAHNFRQAAKPFYLIEAMYYQIFENENREAFNKAERTVIILPDCLSYLGEKCKREREDLGKVCTRCVPKCQINQIMEIADKYGKKNVEGYFSKRALVEQLTNIKKAEQSTLSVIGISCLLTLASGMRQAKEAGLPSRGVFLNFTGCEHWADKPFATETAVERVKSILEEKYGLPDSSA